MYIWKNNKWRLLKFSERHKFANLTGSESPIQDKLKSNKKQLCLHHSQTTENQIFKYILYLNICKYNAFADIYTYQYIFEYI